MTLTLRRTGGRIPAAKVPSLAITKTTSAVLTKHLAKGATLASSIAPYSTSFQVPPASALTSPKHFTHQLTSRRSSVILPLSISNSTAPPASLMPQRRMSSSLSVLFCRRPSASCPTPLSPSLQPHRFKRVSDSLPTLSRRELSGAAAGAMTAAGLEPGGSAVATAAQSLAAAAATSGWSPSASASGRAQRQLRAQREELVSR